MRFHQQWVTRLAPGEAYELLVDVEHYPVWWPQVRAVASLGVDHALVLCRSWLPLTLHLELRPVRRDPALGVLEVSIAGDLTGWARFEITDGPEGGAELTYDQEVAVGGLLGLRMFGWVAHLNHAWMMRGCRRGLGRPGLDHRGGCIGRWRTHPPICGPGR